MGLEFDPTKYGMKDYAKEIKAKNAEWAAYNRDRIEAMSTKISADKSTTTQTASNPAEEVRSDLGVNLTSTKSTEQSVAQQKTPATEQLSKPEPVSEKQVQEEIMFNGNNVKLKTPREYTDKKAHEKAVDTVKDEFIANGTSAGQSVTNRAQARNMAENYVKNEEHLESFYSTRTYLDKNEFKAAEKSRKQARKDYYKQLRDEGVGRREARKRANEWAETNLVRNERLKNKDALGYIAKNRDQFYNPDGTFSQAKYKQFCLNLMNTHTKGGETVNGHLSLKERREAAETLHLDDDAVCDMVHRAGGNFEKDYTEVIQAGVVVGGTAVLAGAGHLIAPSIVVGSTAAASSTAGAAAGAGAGAGAAASAAAGATVSIKGAGAAIGAATGAATMPWLKNLFRDNGNTETRVYAPAKKEEPVTNPENDPVEPEVCELEPKDLNDSVELEADYCCHTIIRGDDPYKIVMTKYRHEDGSRLSHAEALKIAHELKMIHGCKNYRDALNMKVGDEFRCYTEFDGLAHPELKGKKYVIDCDAKTDGKRSKGPMKGKIHNFGGQYNGVQRTHNINAYWYTDCNNNMSDIFNTKSERDAAMAKRQAELNAAAGK